MCLHNPRTLTFSFGTVAKRFETLALLNNSWLPTRVPPFDCTIRYQRARWVVGLRAAHESASLKIVSHDCRIWLCNSSTAKTCKRQLQSATRMGQSRTSQTWKVQLQSATRMGQSQMGTHRTWQPMCALLLQQPVGFAISANGTIKNHMMITNISDLETAACERHQEGAAPNGRLQQLAANVRPPA